jgi:hypothetical protein
MTLGLNVFITPMRPMAERRSKGRATTRCAGRFTTRTRRCRC